MNTPLDNLPDFVSIDVLKHTVALSKEMGVTLPMYFNHEVSSEDWERIAQARLHLQSRVGVIRPA